MQRHTLYAYVDGSDLEVVAASIEERLLLLAAAPGWVTSSPTVVNQKANVPGCRPGDLPDWDLGINLALPDPGAEPDGWFSDVERIAGQLAKLHAAFGREFVIGIADNVRGIAEDLFFIESDAPDLDRLRSAIGVRGG
ncbi:hypothetical protein [Variovorax sp. MHTC-1]|uniref:hypothetical protein n=1 Tax=Variovorax sp. MHTC-1 TaxID=2495593 RepID=UPI000F87074E|nr:hypothetical protein [Variovorax sp. MHTC-1]RST46576.1 hypothetical protein EJI01_28365 [Variovorax sp. MHTC-1]